MDTKTTMAVAALAALAMGGCTHHAKVSSSASSERGAAPAEAGAKGECWGVNACKGQGACGGPDGHQCAGQNACKAQGWLSLTKSECDGRNGKFKAS